MSMTEEHRNYIALVTKTSFLHREAIQYMRGQVPQSNPAVMCPTDVEGRVDVIDKIINVATENLYTVPGYHARYYGTLSKGEGQVYPPVIPFPGFPVPLEEN